MTEASYFGMIILQFVDGKIKKINFLKCFLFFYIVKYNLFM